MKTNAIIPGKSIGIFQLGWKKHELLSHFNNNYEIKDLNTEQKVFYNGFRFWINKQSETVKQISVLDSFDGKLFGKIGLGSTLKDIENNLGKWQDNYDDVYTLPEHKGVCFELKDVDTPDEEWNEEQMPINVISVFYPEEYQE